MIEIIVALIWVAVIIAALRAGLIIICCRMLQYIGVDLVELTKYTGDKEKQNRLVFDALDQRVKLAMWRLCKDLAILIRSDKDRRLLEEVSSRILASESVDGKILNSLKISLIDPKTETEKQAWKRLNTTANELGWLGLIAKFLAVGTSSRRKNA